jgi:hypothetical protein
MLMSSLPEILPTIAAWRDLLTQFLTTTTMKLQIIETTGYTLAVSDEEIKKGDIIYANGGLWKGTTTHCTEIPVTECWVKIVAHLPKNNAPELPLPLLPEITSEPRGFDEFEYTEEDLRKAYDAGGNSREDEINGDGETPFEEFLQSLKQPKWFEAEMEEVAKPMPNIHIKTWELKTTTINDKKYLVGTYNF